jgi:hypothetical protein
MLEMCYALEDFLTMQLQQPGVTFDRRLRAINLKFVIFDPSHSTIGHNERLGRVKRLCDSMGLSGEMPPWKSPPSPSRHHDIGSSSCHELHSRFQRAGISQASEKVIFCDSNPPCFPSLLSFKIPSHHPMFCNSRQLLKRMHILRRTTRIPLAGIDHTNRHFGAASPSIRFRNLTGIPRPHWQLSASGGTRSPLLIASRSISLNPTRRLMASVVPDHVDSRPLCANPPRALKRVHTSLDIIVVRGPIIVDCVCAETLALLSPYAQRIGVPSSKRTVGCLWILS